VRAAVPDGFRLVGLTGGIGSGKSTVAHLIAETGIPVIDADQLARAAVAPGSPALREIAATWPEVIGPDGHLDRRALGRTIFASAEARVRLESILHPRIIELSMERASELGAAGHRLAFYEASLLVETGRYRELDGLVVVEAPEDVRVARVVARDGTAESDVRARMAAQSTPDDKRRLATFLVRNDGSLKDLRPRVAEMLAALRAAIAAGTLPPQRTES
jgi:dephospho-CoA kinase